MSCPFRFRLVVLLFLTLAVTGQAQTPLAIYSDGQHNGFQDWSWVGDRNLQNASPVHSGTYSIRATADAWEALSFYHSDYNLSAYTNFPFWAHGGSSGGQRLQVYFSYPDNSSGPVVSIPTSLPANTWQQYTIPLSSLGAVNATNLHRINIQLTSSGTAGTFYLDDIQFNPLPVPALVKVSLVATQAVRIVDERHFGVNLTVWDTNFNAPQHLTTTALLQEMGTTVVRMPGGSLSDEYHWGSNTTLSNTWQWAVSFNEMARVTTNVGAQAFIVVNYGSGTPQEAAGWVRHANVTNQLGFKYWEIGNECYGTWERDTNALPNHAYTYALRASNYIAQMKAADPSIKIGVVAVPGESSYANGYTDHPAVNPRTGQTNYGWTPFC
jgi:alpha-N-arabinofuranosidase